MKKSIFAAVLGMAAVAAYGQGKIDFGNYLTGPTDPTVKYANSNVPTGKAGLTVGGEFSAQLLYYVGASALDIPSSTSQMSLLTISGASPVGFNAGADGAVYTGYFEGGAVQIPGVTGGTSGFVSFAIEAFNGTSYANSTIGGISSIFQSPTTATSSSGVGGFTPGSWQTFTVQNLGPVPEPTTLALAGLGGLASLVALRRKQS